MLPVNSSARIGMIAFMTAACFALTAGQPARAEGCPAGTVQIDIHEEVTADAVIVHRRCQELSCNAPEPLPPGMTSPGMFVTQEDCEAASAKLVQLVKQRDNFAKKIKELERWEGNQRKDEKEFEALRAEATRDLAWEFIDHLPVSESLDLLKNNPALKGVDIEKIKAAYEATKGLLQTGHGILAKDNKEKSEKIIDGNRALRNAMIDVAGVDEKTKKLLEAASRIIEYGAKAALAASTDKMSDRDKLKTVMALVETLQPWWGLGVLAENGLERWGEYHYAGAALDSLHEAQSGNWNARRYLTDKVDRLGQEINEEQFVMTKYQQSDH